MLLSELIFLLKRYLDKGGDRTVAYMLIEKEELENAYQGELTTAQWEWLAEGIIENHYLDDEDLEYYIQAMRDEGV
jgi:hypothetical protein